MPDPTDLPSCNVMRQHTVQHSSLVKETTQIEDATTQASKAFLNNKPSKGKGKVNIQKVPRVQSVIAETFGDGLSVYFQLTCLSV